MDHILTILPGLPGATTVSGKCSCQARWNGKTEAELQRRYQDHLAEMDKGDPGDGDLHDETPEETERLDAALEATTREDRAQVEREIAAGNYGTPLEEVFDQLDAEDKPHRQAWTDRQAEVVEDWMHDHDIADSITDRAIRLGACKDLLDDLWDAKLIAGS